MKKHDLLVLTLCGFTLGIVGTVIWGYIFHLSYLLTWNIHTAMAVPTAVCFALLTTAILLLEKRI